MARDTLPQIWLLADPEECHDVETGKAIPFYAYISKGWEPAPSTVLRKDAIKATLEELVELCDRDAENINAHDFVGCHRLLGRVLFERAGRHTATQIMRFIAERRGLHGLNGVCGIPDSYGELDVGTNGRDWSGNYGKD